MPTHGCDILDPRLTTVVVPILPPLLSKQGVSDNAVFLLFASKSLVQIVCNPAVGALIDRRVLTVFSPSSIQPKPLRLLAPCRENHTRPPGRK